MKDMFKCNHYIVALKNLDSTDFVQFLHAVVYEKTPSPMDYVGLIKELKTDSQFGLTDLEYKKDYYLVGYTMNRWEDRKKIIEYGLPLEYEKESET